MGLTTTATCIFSDMYISRRLSTGSKIRYFEWPFSVCADGTFSIMITLDILRTNSIVFIVSCTLLSCVIKLCERGQSYYLTVLTWFSGRSLQAYSLDVR